MKKISTLNVKIDAICEKKKTLIVKNLILVLVNLLYELGQLMIIL